MSHKVALRCQAANCDSDIRSLVKFFDFPKDSERRKQWIRACQRGSAWVPTSRSQKLCEMHFDDDQFENRRVDGLRKLKWNAVPAVKLPLFEEEETIIKLEAPTYGIQTESLYQGYEERLMMEPDELINEPKSTCQICDQIIDNYPNNLCKVCEKKFEIDQELNIQKKKKRFIANYYNYQCEECLKTFFNVNTYQRHIKCHDEKKPYRCDKCQKRFYHSKNLAEHMEIHENKLHVSLDPTVLQAAMFSEKLTTETCVEVKTEELNSKYPDTKPITLGSFITAKNDTKNFLDTLTMVQIENFELFDQERDSETVDLGDTIFYEGSVSPVLSSVTGNTEESEAYGSVIKIETETLQSSVDYEAFSVNTDQTTDGEVKAEISKDRNDYVAFSLNAEPETDCEIKMELSESLTTHQGGNLEPLSGQTIEYEAKVVTLATNQDRNECYICKHCNKDFMYFGNYAKHLDQHSIGKLMCKFCHQMFSSTYQIRKHIRDFHSNQEMFECTVCFQTLPKHYFASHMRTHRTDDKTLICKYCGCRFSEPSELFYHFKNKHSDSAESKVTGKGCEEAQPIQACDDLLEIEKYKCKYCGLLFDDVIKMYHHVKVHVKQTRTTKKTLSTSSGRNPRT
ncbi:transcription factor E4F1-like [Bradysia coprophila]|uniref:transcription factor E4F1-like n=1 Tax=Bradysia coprophila TaxID=38358 RepID=UPI00187DA4CC|nr:transcription factor E4F1-like [Bradysia coprophila]